MKVIAHLQRCQPVLAEMRLVKGSRVDELPVIRVRKERPELRLAIQKIVLEEKGWIDREVISDLREECSTEGVILAPIGVPLDGRGLCIRTQQVLLNQLRLS